MSEKSWNVFKTEMVAAMPSCEAGLFEEAPL